MRTNSEVKHNSNIVETSNTKAGTESDTNNTKTRTGDNTSLDIKDIAEDIPILKARIEELLKKQREICGSLNETLNKLHKIKMKIMKLAYNTKDYIWLNKKIGQTS